MEWRDDGIILSVRGHGETSAIAEVLTAEHGRCLGLVRGGRSRQQRPVLQPGNHIGVTWRARLEEHLGIFQVEPLDLKAGLIMEEPLRLMALTSLTALAQMLPEREPHRRMFDALQIVIDAFDRDDVWPALLVRWELGLLDELGFGLDLSHCAATGARAALAYVSPKSGRAVSAEAGKPYAARLFSLPAFLAEGGEAGRDEVSAGLKLTGYFLGRHVLEPRGLALPQARARLADAFAA